MELFRNPDLEAAILDAPLEYGPRMVYGDWLIAQGDPRGEWFALSAAVEATPLDVRLRSAATENFNANGALFLGHGVRLRPGSWFGWLGGFLDEARLQNFRGLENAAGAAADLFAQPHARFLRTVAIGRFPDAADIVEALVAAQLPLLETVTLIDSNQSINTAIEINAFADLPRLRRLGARRVDWSVPLPQLRELYVEVDARTWSLLFRTVPRLVDLTLDCRNHSPEVLEIAALAGQLPLERLRVLGHAKPGAILRAFTPPPPALRYLDLSHSNLTDEDLGELDSWPPDVELMALRTEVTPATVERLTNKGRVVVANRPKLREGEDLQWDTGPETWWCHRARVEGRTSMLTVPDGGRQLFSSAIRTLPAQNYDRDLLDICVSLPSERWHAWPWAAAACVRSWKYEHALCEAIAREGLMREPNEPNFYAFITYALRKQKLFAEAAAEVPRAAKAIAEPPKTPQETGPPLCLIDCMYTLAQNGDYAGAIEFHKKFTIDDPNLQAALAICYAATGQVDEARAALAKAVVAEGAAVATYVTEPNRRAVFDHAVAAVVLMPVAAVVFNAQVALTPEKAAALSPDDTKLAALVAAINPVTAPSSSRAKAAAARAAALRKAAAKNPDNPKLAELVAALDPEETIAQPGSQPLVDFGSPIEALRPELTVEARKTIAIEALTRTWTVYPEREWLRTCRTLEVLKDDPRWVALQKT